MNQNITTIEQAWQEYQRKLLGFIQSRVDSAEDAEDILNDVFIALIKETENHATPDHVAAWLYRVSKNKITDYYRKKKQFVQLPDDLAVEYEDIGAIAELSSCVLSMIRLLPQDYQQAMILSEIEGKKQRQVAEELGLSLAAVKSRILRGRGKLHKSILNCCALYRNDAGKVIDYTRKSTGYCDDCAD